MLGPRFCLMGKYHHHSSQEEVSGNILLLSTPVMRFYMTRKPHTFLLSSTRWSSNALTVGKSKTNDGLKAIWNSFATMLIKETLDKLSIPASMNGLSSSSSSSVAMTSFTKVMSCFLTKAAH